MSERDGFRAAVDRAMLANDALDSAISHGLDLMTWPQLLMEIDVAYEAVTIHPKAEDWVQLAGMCLEAARLSTSPVAEELQEVTA